MLSKQINMNQNSFFLKNNFCWRGAMVAQRFCKPRVEGSIPFASFDGLWAGTQAAKGGRLCKRSVMSKGVMEK